MALPEPFLSTWTSSLPHPPNITTSTPRTITTGSGLSIFSNTLAPAILSARHEIIIVTCFLANPSDSLAVLSSALKELALQRISMEHLHPLRVRIGFSSRSPLQRLFHTFSRDGYIYPPEKWAPVLGLPDASTLEAAKIDLGVKSLFFNPLGILHLKYVVIDREVAWLPSCNVSWECWFEGCVEVSGGGIVGGLVAIWSDAWGRGRWAVGEQEWVGSEVIANDTHSLANTQHDTGESTHNPPTRTISLPPSTLTTALLPSTWHINPRFRPFLSPPPPPPTPLNTALLALFSTATTSISLITPNVTCPVVIDALAAALYRGVNVRIRTSRNMMVLEQIVTAGTTMERRLRALRKKHNKMAVDRYPKVSWWRRIFFWKKQHATLPDLESAHPPPGSLEIEYYTPDAGRSGAPDEPVVSHLKMTLVDSRFLVLGSGNMDRASWYTSQELGVLFYSPAGFGGWEDAWEGPLATRTSL